MAKQHDGAAREAARRAKAAAGRPARADVGLEERAIIAAPISRTVFDGGDVERARALASSLADERSSVFALLGRLADGGDVEAAVELARKASEQVIHLEQRRRAAMLGRDRAVADLRRQGWSWVRVAREVGISRQALMKRS